MMKFQLPSDDVENRTGQVQYDSAVTLQAKSMEGVEFTILRLSLARRMDLARRVLELSRRLEFREAGEGVEDRLEANVLSCEINQLYLNWGLIGIDGLRIDGADATPELLAEKGPEDLATEVVTAIKAQCGLSENERKN